MFWILKHKSKMDSIIPPRGQLLVECMGESTILDVAYVKEHLFRNDIQVLVFVEDWSAEDLMRIQKAATSLHVDLVRSTKIQHQPTVNYITNRDKIRNLKIKTDMCKGIVVELNPEKEAEREAAKTTDMKDLTQQAELQQSGYRGGQEINEAQSTIAEVEQYGALC